MSDNMQMIAKLIIEKADEKRPEDGGLFDDDLFHTMLTEKSFQNTWIKATLKLILFYDGKIGMLQRDFATGIVEAARNVVEAAQIAEESTEEQKAIAHQVLLEVITDQDSGWIRYPEQFVVELCDEASLPRKSTLSAMSWVKQETMGRIGLWPGSFHSDFFDFQGRMPTCQTHVVRNLTLKVALQEVPCCVVPTHTMS